MKRILLLSMVFSFGLVFSAWAQRTVSGKVTDDTGEGLPGVNVVIKGTTTGVTTDLDGNYQISVPDDNTVLVFSSVGMATQEVTVGARTSIDLGMSVSTSELQEVVVTAYGIERAPDEVVFQTERIESDLLMIGQEQNAASGLVGKVAGLQINVQDNGVNPQTQVLLRGLNSISQNNEPMFVIDGAIASVGAFDDLNPFDIAEINVVKGPHLGAQYGAPAANGVLLITTKKGRVSDKFTVGINTSYTLEKVAYMPDFQTEYGIGWDGHYDPIENTNWGPRFDGVVRQIGPNFPEGYVLDEQMVPYAPIANNLLDFFETGSTLQNTVYFSGGNETSRIYMSLGNVQTEGIVLDDEYERTTARLNASTEIGKFEFGINSGFTMESQSVVGDEIGDQSRPLYWFVLNTPANIPLTRYKDWDNPDSYAHADNYYNAYYQNPYWAIGTNRDNDDFQRLLGNIYGTYEITDNILVTGRLGVDRSTNQGKEWRDAQEYDATIQCCHSAVTSFVRDTENQRTEINGNLVFTGEFELSSDFTLTPMVGAAFTDLDSRSSTLQANNLSIPGFYDVSNGTGQLVGSVDAVAKRTYGFFGQVDLGYKNFATLSISGRQDYTSTLPSNDNSYFYPSIGANVRLTEAIPALGNLSWLSYAKVSLSNTTVYNDLPIYALNEVYSSPTGFPYGSVNGFAAPTTAVDSGIKKEKLNTTELAWNVGLLEDRFQFEGALYKTITTDLITYTTPSVAAGASSFLTNIGRLSTKGIELAINGNILKFGDFSWDGRVNYTSYVSNVREILPGGNDDETFLISWGGGSYGIYAIEGKAFPQIKAQNYERDPQGRVVIDPTTGNPQLGEVEAMGRTTPKYILGGTSIMSWKGISFSATVDYRTGHVYYEQGSDAMEFTGRSVESVSSGRRDFVFPNSSYLVDGEYVENTNITTSGGVMGFWQNNWNDAKENYVKDATALKVRSINISYNVPKKILQSTGVFTAARIGFIARNPFTRLPEENRFADPEFNNTSTNTSTNSGNDIGIGGYFTSPPTRSFGFNLNLEF